jgi:uncharacterized membrane protein YcgQ (UPF0703/DUF1980 family)
VGHNIPIDNKSLLVTNFVAQSFRVAHRNIVYIHIFIGISNYTCMSIYIYTIFLKKLPRYINSYVMPVLFFMLFTRHDAGLINCIPSRVKALPFGFRHGQKMDDHMHKSYDLSSAQVWLIFLYPFISHFFKNKQKMQMIITAMLELLIL